jgi:hypothetical protein
MKRVLLIALIITAVGYTPATAAETHQRTLRGTCVWQSVSYETTSGASSSAGPVTVLAQFTFDGHGGLLINNYDVNQNGTFSSSGAFSGTYQIDPSGHGTFTYTSPISGRTLLFDFFETPAGKAIRTMLQSDNNSPPLPRVSSGECRFDE